MFQDMDASGWGQPELPPSDPVKDAIMKEQLLKCVTLDLRSSLTDESVILERFLPLERTCPVRIAKYTYLLSRLIGTLAMLAKIKSVQAEIDKLSSGNEMLQMYIDNLTKQMAAQRR